MTKQTNKKHRNKFVGTADCDCRAPRTLLILKLMTQHAFTSVYHFIQLGKCLAVVSLKIRATFFLPSPFGTPTFLVIRTDIFNWPIFKFPESSVWSVVLLKTVSEDSISIIVFAATEFLFSDNFYLFVDIVYLLRHFVINASVFFSWFRWSF